MTENSLPSKNMGFRGGVGGFTWPNFLILTHQVLKIVLLVVPFLKNPHKKIMA